MLRHFEAAGAIDAGDAVAFDTAGRIRRVRRRRRGPWGIILACILGAASAAWLLGRVLPRVEIHAAENGEWQSVEIDWSRTMLGHPRG